MKRDYDLARKYYRLGVLESDAYCYCQLGAMYALGRGVKKDAHAALDYYMKDEGGRNGRCVVLLQCRVAIRKR